MFFLQIVCISRTERRRCSSELVQQLLANSTVSQRCLSAGLMHKRLLIKKFLQFLMLFNVLKVLNFEKRSRSEEPCLVRLA